MLLAVTTIQNRRELCSLNPGSIYNDPNLYKYDNQRQVLVVEFEICVLSKTYLAGVWARTSDTCYSGPWSHPLATSYLASEHTDLASQTAPDPGMMRWATN